MSRAGRRKLVAGLPIVDSKYRPQLATLVTEPPRGDAWLHEIKFDGYRIGCRLLDGRATLISRSGKDWTHRFPDIADAAARLGARDALIDGEVAVLLPDGRTSFELLQQSISSKPAPRRSSGAPSSLVYFAFDLLRLEGERLDRLPLEERKTRLRGLISPRKTERIRYVDHVEGQGPALVCEVAFTEWTGDGKVRHPSFQGLRTDKKPREVMRERS
jgi:bifunctional non-homologous end joining protein LigD